jgi:hypothetical protein
MIVIAAIAHPHGPTPPGLTLQYFSTFGHISSEFERAELLERFNKLTSKLAQVSRLLNDIGRPAAGHQHQQPLGARLLGISKLCLLLPANRSLLAAAVGTARDLREQLVSTSWICC